LGSIPDSQAHTRGAATFGQLRTLTVNFLTNLQELTLGEIGSNADPTLTTQASLFSFRDVQSIESGAGIDDERAHFV
jgi:hypothetical protein